MMILMGDYHLQQTTLHNFRICECVQSKFAMQTNNNYHHDENKSK